MQGLLTGTLSFHTPSATISPPHRSNREAGGQRLRRRSHGSTGTDRKADVDQRKPHVTDLHKALGRSCGTRWEWRGTRGLEAQSRRSPLFARSSGKMSMLWEQPAISTVNSSGGTGGRFLRARGTDGPRRLHRNESCGGHLREISDRRRRGKRDDENFSYVAAWEYTGDRKPRNCTRNR